MDVIASGRKVLLPHKEASTAGKKSMPTQFTTQRWQRGIGSDSAGTSLPRGVPLASTQQQQSLVAPASRQQQQQSLVAALAHQQQAHRRQFQRRRAHRRRRPSRSDGRCRGLPQLREVGRRNHRRQRRERRALFCRRTYISELWSDIFAFLGDNLGRPALADILRPNWATWAWADLVKLEDRPEGWSEGLYDQCFNSVLGNCRHSGTGTDGVIRTTLVLPNGKSSLVRMPQPPEELKSKALDVIWGDNPPTDALKFAWKERSDLTPVGDGEWIDYEGHEGTGPMSLRSSTTAVVFSSAWARKPPTFRTRPSDICLIGTWPNWSKALGFPSGCRGSCST